MPIRANKFVFCIVYVVSPSVLEEKCSKNVHDDLAFANGKVDDSDFAASDDEPSEDITVVTVLFVALPLLCSFLICLTVLVYTYISLPQ
jgi:hypothetical protein